MDNYDKPRRSQINSPERRLEMRAMGKSELAALYFPASQPKTALNHLMSWVKRCRPLSEELLAMGYRPQDKWFTPRQVDAIVRHLGEP